ncbi:class I SAM-dependent methyltransferase [Archangium sp.]|uniref:class I SAM-dependent methyltransferase n=1 Tax=Archangium sp. TaxID=1872627 RepID=UPI002D6CF3C9|nr:methyltransferase domain-containing protein [Archangium sp.]HYO51938.1 methyltransferase domain-containing protein [Archangium sp.]
MSWYDTFSGFYDRMLERIYLEQRRAAAEALRLEPGQVVLDIPCGTGQSFDGLAPRLLPGGVLIGSDFSAGMLERARERVRRKAWTHVHLHHGDVHALTPQSLETAVGRPVELDRLHVFLGISAFPGWTEAFERLWGLLRPGGRCVVVDVHAERLGLHGRMVNLVAQADIRRRFWEPLERLANGYERTELPSRWEHGGRLFLATGIKPPLSARPPTSSPPPPPL